MPWLMRIITAASSMLIPAMVFADQQPVDFAHDVAPVLKKHCVACHGGGETKGGFSLNTRELLLEAEAAIPGKPDESRLWELITSSDAEEQMPPKERPRLTDKERAVLRRWIEGGLAWEVGFTFAEQRYEPPLAPRRPELPPPADGRTNTIDRIVDAYLAENNISRPQPVPDAVFLRRVYLDVVGVLPESQEVELFLQDAKPDKRQSLVRELLVRDTAYAEHWLTFWNDLLRNDYSGTGFITGGRKQITSWLYKSLIENRPYDEFVRELIVPTADSEGFTLGIQWRGNVNASQSREIQFAQNLGQAFLGINLKCASCHDSFIDRWTLEETYGLAQIYATKPLVLHRCDKPLDKTATAAWLFPELGQIDAHADQPTRLKQLAALMTHPQNGRFTRTVVNRLWHRLMGRGIVHPVDAMHTEPWSADLLDYLAVHLAENGYDLKKTIELICTSQAYQAQTPPSAASDPSRYVFRGPIARRMTAEQFMDAVWQITGAAPRTFDAPVERESGAPALVVRASLLKNNSFLASLGRPTRDQIVSMRPNELTTLEAIDLANGQVLADAIAEGAKRLLESASEDTAESKTLLSEHLLESLYLSALARRPTADEAQLARELLGDAPSAGKVEDLLWSVFMLPEFQLVR